MQGEQSNSTVYILGAGFTRAFAQNAPLLKVKVRQVGLRKIVEKFQAFPDIEELLSPLIKQGEVNAEELLSRLYSSSPYESEFLSDAERQLLYSEIFKNYTKLIHDIKLDTETKVLFNQFAAHLLEQGGSCITFNYDTQLDKALFRLDPSKWHPDGGYGFFCFPAKNLITGGAAYMDDCKTLLLKLHGSLNWHVKKGHNAPYSIDSVVHYDNWSAPLSLVERKQVELHIEKESLIIPPVLNKSELNAQPVLRLIWSEAFRKLRTADRVVFIGYSMPKTDIAARYLFQESLTGKEKRITIVTNHSDAATKQAKLAAYQEVLPRINRSNFYFEGAIQWAQEQLNASPAADPQPAVAAA